jgi:hypothetical protein
MSRIWRSTGGVGVAAAVDGCVADLPAGELARSLLSRTWIAVGGSSAAKRFRRSCGTQCCLFGREQLAFNSTTGQVAWMPGFPVETWP